MSTMKMPPRSPPRMNNNNEYATVFATVMNNTSSSDEQHSPLSSLPSSSPALPLASPRSPKPRTLGSPPHLSSLGRNRSSTEPKTLRNRIVEEEEEVEEDLPWIQDFPSSNLSGKDFGSNSKSFPKHSS
ncbi:uncharacterized protein A4U43_UnF3600 [Asparagus officinalis]|uniref:Uncharacterized protein n=1 Tax=Asparagus officinalis TaxID=4686 RepID=A0A1R3L732_ASPOF|nr:uncharacterized protein A4U43_UnF3600 [Asparagus officinalis]